MEYYVVLQYLIWMNNIECEYSKIPYYKHTHKKMLNEAISIGIIIAFINKFPAKILSRCMFDSQAHYTTLNALRPSDAYLPW